MTPFEEHPLAWSALFALDLTVCAVAVWMTFTEREPMADEFKCFWIERANRGGLAVWKRIDNGEIRESMDSWGPGALFAEAEAPDDVHVKTPDSWANLRTWARTGDPKRPETFTARPSIQTHGPKPWHGFLTNGVLRSVP